MKRSRTRCAFRCLTLLLALAITGIRHQLQRVRVIADARTCGTITPIAGSTPPP